jgi:two-component system, LuxR family, sensor kinase FixL
MDRIAIQQVVLNLVRNALDAMADSPRRALIITTRISSGMVQIAVADTGSGLAPEIAVRLFQPFLTTKPDGLGIGLSVCRSIVEIHRGRLWAEANPVGGTIFNLALPLTNTPETAQARPDKAPASAAGISEPKIQPLIADNYAGATPPGRRAG